MIADAEAKGLITPGKVSTFCCELIVNFEFMFLLIRNMYIINCSWL